METAYHTGGLKFNARSSGRTDRIAATCAARRRWPAALLGCQARHHAHVQTAKFAPLVLVTLVLLLFLLLFLTFSSLGVTYKGFYCCHTFKIAYWKI